MILIDGHVKDVSFNNLYEFTIKDLFRLPASGTYSGFSDEKGILYFFDKETKKSGTKYHKSFSKEGHKKFIEVEDVNKEFRIALNHGNFLWFLGAIDHKHFEIGK